MLRVAGCLLVLSGGLLLASTRPSFAQEPQVPDAQSDKQDIFHVKYIVEGTVYVDAGRNAGLKEGMSLTVARVSSPSEATESVRFRDDAVVAQVRVLNVADTSAVCEILSTRKDPQVGDLV